jgi:Bacterial Ig-like domain (group 2)
MKNRRSLAVIAILAFSSACSRGKSDFSTGPGSGTVASVSVTATTNSVFIASTISLTATALNSSGSAVDGQTVTWGSSTPAVATVSAAGVVTGVAAGVTSITATIGTIVGQTAITVAASPAQLSCANVTPLAMNVGDVHMLTGVERSSLCVGGGAAGSEYVLIPLNANLDTSATFTAFTLDAANTVAVTNPPTPQRVSTGSTVSLRTARALPRDHVFEQRLRQIARTELTPKIAAARTIRAGVSRSTSPSGTISAITGLGQSPVVGSIIQLNTNALSACASPVMHAARIVAVSQNAVVALDTLAPPNGFTSTDV